MLLEKSISTILVAVILFSTFSYSWTIEQRYLRVPATNSINKNDILGNGNTQFKIGGINTSEVIEKLKDIGGVPITKIEDRFNKGTDTGRIIHGGEVELIKQLVEANNFVLGKNLSHQEIANWLYDVMKMAKYGREIDIEYHGIKFKIYQDDLRVRGGAFCSPFTLEEITPTSQYTLTNLATGQKVKWTEDEPNYIKKFGYYQNVKDVPDDWFYSISAERLIAMFNKAEEEEKADKYITIIESEKPFVHDDNSALGTLIKNKVPANPDPIETSQ